MNSTTNDLYAATADGIHDLSQLAQDLLLRNALHPLNSRIAMGDMESVTQEALLYATGVMDLNLHPNVTDISALILKSHIREYNFDTLKSHPMFSYISVEGAFFTDQSPGRTSYWVVWQSLNVDIFKAAMGLPNPYGRTLYLCTVQLSKDEQWNEMTTWNVDQTTGAALFPLLQVTYPWQAFAYWTKAYGRGWGTDLYVNPYSGQVELFYERDLHTDNGSQHAIAMALNTQTLSEELRSQLTGQPNDRLFLFFRKANGHMIAASHGKFFSLSDVDMRFVNPLAQPLNMSAYQFYTCLESTDALILEACRKLVAKYHNWTLIPQSHQEMLLNNSRYWVAVGYSTSSLKATIVLLKDLQSVMGSVDASIAKVWRDMDSNRSVTAIVFGVATGVATIVPLILGLCLRKRLRLLAKGMDRITKLDFSQPHVPRAVIREIHIFQKSFCQMERGLRAFSKFVPSAVVTQLVAGRINTDDKMVNTNITVMFADIAGFSTVSEMLPPARLVEVCTEYFEVMCKHVVECHGTIDKFIGDCIMAMWNAPLPNPGHERNAVTAALRMQNEVLSLHEDWQQRGLPALKFRLGLHTGNCLVGNFGCSYRVSYTCLGNNVILASRLEALNKQFGTTLCVSQPTRAACRSHFNFRHLCKIVVPDRDDPLSLYEVVCATDTAEEAAEEETEEEEEEEPMSLPMSPCGGDTSPYLVRPMLDDSLRLKPVDLELCQSWSPHQPPVSPPHNETAESERRQGDLPYHWGWHDRQAVLTEVVEYEKAYNALLEGRCTECCLLLSRCPDKAWQALTAQLKRQIEIGRDEPWDGVFI
eukprot:GGOE01054268.1.p1 GENE.GGOE01054268.1~~GGOE01054268.1.p1  ORF type:complete len:850 (-),score=240.25 GGOE01054268.1:1353-3794(-)